MPATPTPQPLMPDTLQWLPADGQPAQQLLILLHGFGSHAADMAPLAQALRQQFPLAAVLAPQGFEALAAPAAPGGRQWFSLQGLTEANRPPRVAAVLPRLADWVRAAQQATGVGQQATALMGFSQGAILSLHLAQQHDGLVGRVLSFSGRYAALPDAAPQHTTLHFFHGSEDPAIPVAHARAAIERLSALGGDATIDIANGVGHAIPPVLVQCALQRLTGHIPHRTWAAALSAAAASAAPGQAPQPD